MKYHQNSSATLFPEGMSCLSVTLWSQTALLALVWPPHISHLLLSWKWQNKIIFNTEFRLKVWNSQANLQLFVSTLLFVLLAWYLLEMLKWNCSVIVATKLCILKILLWFYVTLKENPRIFLNECNITMKIQHWREILYLSHCINGKYLWAFEGISIHNSDAEIKMNSRSEFHQPTVPRVAMTNEVHLK